MVLPALDSGGYHYETQVNIGSRPGGGRHVVDAVLEKDGRKVLVSLKWQQSSGTTEQKIPFEVICLVDALATGEYARAYLVLGGAGWTLRGFYTGGGLSEHLTKSDGVKILTFEDFIALANQGKL